MNKFHTKNNMKKFLKLIVAILVAVAILGAIMFLIDCSLVKSDKEPMFAKNTTTFDDGGSKIYIGVGYKIIDFNRLDGYDETKIGFWNIKYEDYEKEYSLYNKEEIKDEVQNSGDLSEILIDSGDNNKPDIESGEEQDIVASGENQEIVTSGDTAIEEYYFNATIIGINQNTLIVQALEDDPITKSSDMFTFSVEDASIYLIAQKVRIKYTGMIRESYPAQISVLGIEVIE